MSNPLVHSEERITRFPKLIILVYFPPFCFFFHHPLLRKIRHTGGRVGGGGGLFLHLIVSKSVYIFSLGSFQHLPLSSSALTLGFTPTSVFLVLSWLRSSLPTGYAWLQMCIDARLS